MRIPNGPNGEMTVSASQMRLYGSGGFRLDAQEDSKGCPRLYKAKYVDRDVPDEEPSYPLMYGTYFHKIMQIMEEDGLTPDEAVLQAFPVAGTPEMMAEAKADLTAYMERGASPTDLYGTLSVENELSALLYEDEEYGPVYWRGFLDWLGMDMDDPHTIHVVDWKTNRFPPKVEDVISDVQLKSYCTAPGTPILTEDLQWVPVEELVVGQKLLAFDEEPVSQNRRSKARHWKVADVEAAKRQKVPCSKVTFESGVSMVVADTHQWLVRDHGNRILWRSTTTQPRGVGRPRRAIAVGDTIRRYVTPWTYEDSYESGWMAGFLDGEGSFGVSNTVVSFSQKEGPVLEHARRWLKERGFSWYENSRPEDVVHVALNGGVGESLRLLGICRPERLLSKVTIEHREFRNISGVDDTVASVESVGLHDVISLQTSTRTYLAAGYGAHNCWLVRENSKQFGIPQDRVRVVVHLDAIKWREVVVEYTVEEIEDWQDWAVAVCRTILRDEDAEPVINPGCDYCPIRWSCPAFNDLPQTAGQMAEGIVGIEDPEQRLAWRDAANKVRLLLEKQVKKIDAAMSEHAMERGGLVIGDQQWVIEQVWGDKWDLPALHDAMGDRFYEVVTPVKSRIEKITKDWSPDATSAVKQAVERVPGDVKAKRKKVETSD